MKNKEDDYLSIKEVCAITGINSSILYGITSYETLPCEMIAGKKVIKKSVLENWSKSNLRKSIKGAGEDK